MRSIRKKAERLAVVVAAALLWSGVGCREPLAAPMPAAHPEDATPRRGGTLHLAYFADVRSVDPAGPTGGESRSALEALYAGLVDYDAEGNLTPDLATRWEVADDGRTYRFFLREGVRFHDGDEVTAEDLKRSAERTLHRTTASPHASAFDDLLGYDDYVSGKAEHLEGVQVEGLYVVSYRIKDADATFLKRLAMHALRPVCKTAGDRYSDTFKPCGAGPFKLGPDGFQRGIGLRVVRHDAYFQPGLPYLDGIHGRPFFRRRSSGRAA